MMIMSHVVLSVTVPLSVPESLRGPLPHDNLNNAARARHAQLTFFLGGGVSGSFNRAIDTVRHWDVRTFPVPYDLSDY
jgi:hypothetical protein